MISPLPWKLDESDPSRIFDANGHVIADNYIFKHVDDFEAICEFVNFAADAVRKFTEKEFKRQLKGTSKIKNPRGILNCPTLKRETL